MKLRTFILAVRVLAGSTMKWKHCIIFAVVTSLQGNSLVTFSRGENDEFQSVYSQSNNVGGVKRYTRRVYTPLCTALYKGLLWLMFQPITSDCMSVLQGGFFSLRGIINWVINGHKVTRKSESGASESLGYSPPLMFQLLCTVWVCLVPSSVRPSWADSHADSLLNTSGLGLNLSLCFLGCCFLVLSAQTIK